MRREVRSLVERGELNVLLTTYTLFERESGAEDCRFLRSLWFEYLILDEAHGIKNSKSSRYTQLNRLRTNKRLLLSGTPVQNDLQELLSLLSFLMPEEFNTTDCELLLSAFGYDKRDKGSRRCVSLEKLRGVLAPFVLQRLKRHVLTQLVEKKVEHVYLEMTTFQREVYSGILLSAVALRERKKEAAQHEAAVFDGVHLGRRVLRVAAGAGPGVSEIMSESVSDVVQLAEESGIWAGSAVLRCGN